MFQRLLRLLLILGSAVGLMFVGTGTAPFTSATMATGHALLPDLQTLPPRDIEIVVSGPGPKGERHLRFDNRIWNSGAGPVEAFPVSRDCDGDGNNRNDRLAVQNIYYDSNGSGAFDRADAVLEQHEIGCMEFHARHNHWHIEDFATYELFRLLSSGALGDRVGVSTKVSFCMIDTFDHSVELPGEPSGPYYTQCGRNQVYGISVGWGDEYQSTLADQWIVINGVADGDYCLVSTANPANPVRRIVESNYGNNTAGVRINIAGNTVTSRDPTVACGP